MSHLIMYSNSHRANPVPLCVANRNKETFNWAVIKSIPLYCSSAWLSEDKWSVPILVISKRARNQRIAVWAKKLCIICIWKQPKNPIWYIIHCYLERKWFNGMPQKLHLSLIDLFSPLSQRTVQSFNCRGWELLLCSAMTKIESQAGKSISRWSFLS